MINLKTITAGVETILNAGLTGYTITRNEERNVDPNIAAQNNGWIGIYRGRLEYETYATGSIPWMAHIEVKVEVQIASFTSGEDAEDKLQDAEKAVIDVLVANKKLNNTVDMTNGYSIDYEYNADEEIYHHAAIITIKAEARC